MKKLLTYLSLFILSIGVLTSFGFKKTQTQKEPTYTLKQSELNSIINLATQSVTEAYKIECWRVSELNAVTNPNIQIVNYLKALKVDTLKNK